MKQLQDASSELISNLLFALGHSMDLKRDGVDPMMPFAVVIKGGSKTLKTFAGDTPAYGDKMFERTIMEENPDFAVYARDSQLLSEGVTYDVVLLKAYDKQDTEIYQVVQKYQPKTETQDFEEIGNPGFLGTEVINFRTACAAPAQNNEGKPPKPWWKIW